MQANLIGGDRIHHNEVVAIRNEHLLPLVAELYGLDGYAFKPVEAHDGGRNVVYACEREGDEALMVRIAYLGGRSREDYLAELAYVRYLFEHGGSVSNVVSSRQGNLLEELEHHGRAYYIAVFTKARGRGLADNHYQYREGVPITEYYTNTGKVLGKLHQLSKAYVPDRHRRYSFSDKYNAESIERLIPASLPLLQEKLLALLHALDGLDKDRNNYGLVHFDYNDGNYSIDYTDGQITVYDFDNACYCWYMFDLASLWMNGVGWIQFEPDAGKRRKFMEDYFTAALEGYRSETELDDAMLAKLPLFIQVNQMEAIMEAFEDMRRSGEEPECDEELSYRIKCVEDDITYMGLFHEIYSSEAPFEYEPRAL